MTVSLHRWVVKKAARVAMVVGSFISGSLALRKLAGRGPTIRVLTYHRFGDAVRDPWCVSAAAFEEQMRWLAERKLAVSLDDVERFVRGEIELPDGAGCALEPARVGSRRIADAPGACYGRPRLGAGRRDR